jgi:hypothetical protein
VSPRQDGSASEATGGTCLLRTVGQSHKRSPAYQQPYHELVSKSMCCCPGKPLISYCSCSVPWKSDSLPEANDGSVASTRRLTVASGAGVWDADLIRT